MVTGPALSSLALHGAKSSRPLPDFSPRKAQTQPSLGGAALQQEGEKRERDSTSYLSNRRQLIIYDKHLLPLPEKKFQYQVAVGIQFNFFFF